MGSFKTEDYFVFGYRLRYNLAQILNYPTSGNFTGNQNEEKIVVCHKKFQI